MTSYSTMNNFLERKRIPMLTQGEIKKTPSPDEFTGEL